MTNPDIAELLDQTADLLEFEAANPFRIRAYRSAARTIRDLPTPIASIVADPEQRLTDIQGIGKDLAEKLTTLVETGKLPFMEELLERIPETVLAILRVPGLGPKKAAALYNELGIATLDQLQAACEAGKVRELKGFAKKTEETILAGITLAASADKRMRWAKADTIAEQLIAFLRDAPGVEQLEMAGSYRRGRETVGDLDVLVEAKDAAPVMDRLAEFPGIADLIGRGDTKMSVRLAGGPNIDLRIVPKESFGAALQYFTGSKDHNVVLRGMAKKRGLKINEYGVFRVDGEEEAYLAGASEAEVYATLDLPTFPPELREARQEFTWAEQGELPALIELSDICGDLHMHTRASDGKQTLAEMVEAAKERGLKYIAITDHSKRVTMANGLNEDRLWQQWEEIDALNAEVSGIEVLKGVEVDILEKGGLDIRDECLQDADWVVASVHYGQNQPLDQITKRIVDALANPHVSAIAHPTGRLINRRDPYAVDMEAVLDAAVEHGKLMELNANPARLDLNDIHCAAAKARGIPIVISTDAHSFSGLDKMRHGVLQARRGGLTKDDVANTRTWEQMRKLIGR